MVRASIYAGDAMRRFLIAAATAMVLLSGCDNSHSAANWGAFQENFINRSFELNPPFGAGQGKHEFDGRLPDWSEAGLAAQAQERLVVGEAHDLDARRIDLAVERLQILRAGPGVCGGARLAF